MTNRELNEAIARLKGWEPCLGMVSDWKHPPSPISMALPDFLDDDHLGELLELATKVMGHWDLSCVDINAYEAAPDFAEARDTYPGPRNGLLQTGITPSIALARAIVGYKEQP